MTSENIIKTQKFLQHLYSTASKVCGSDYQDSYLKIKSDRDNFLKQAWNESESNGSTEHKSDELFREIDFENIVIHAAGYLNGARYVEFLIKVVKICQLHGKTEKAAGILQSLFTIYQTFMDDKTRAEAHLLRGDVYLSENKYKASESEYTTAREIYSEINNSIGIAKSLNAFGILKIESGGSHLDAIKDFQKAKEIAEEYNHDSLRQKAMVNLSNISIILGNYEEARENFESLISNLAENNLYLLAKVRHNLSIIHKFMKQYDKASENIQISLELSRKTGDIHQQAISYLEYSEITYRMGQFETSAELVTTAFHLFHEIGDKVSCGDVYKILGMISREMDHKNLAETFFNTSLNINKKYHYPLNLGETYTELAVHYKNQGRSDSARQSYTNAIEAFSEVGAKRKIEETEKYLTELKI